MATRSNKRPRKPISKPAPAPFIAATVSLGEVYGATWTGRTKDAAIVARSVQNTVWSAANMNATACMGQRLRLYRPANGKSIESAMYAGKGVDPRRKSWLRGDGALQPWRKSMALASAADDIEEVVDHPLLDLMYQPDPYMTASQWMWLLFFFLESAGRCYILAGDRMKGGVPAGLYLMRPQHVRVFGSRERYISHYEYGVDDASLRRFEPEQVCYMRLFPHPARPLDAMSWLQAVEPSTDLEAAALQSEIARWNNGGNPGLVLQVKDETKKTTIQQIEQMAASFDRKHRGVNKSGSTAWLLNATVAEYGAKPHEMQYVEGMARMETSIYRAAGIPEPVWKMASSNKASATAADPQWMGQTILPRLNVVAEALTCFVLPMFPGTEGWWFAYDNPVAEDRAALVAECVALTDKGLMTGNEARAALGHELGGEELDVPRYMGSPLAGRSNAGPATEGVDVPAEDEPGSGDGAAAGDAAGAEAEAPEPDDGASVQQKGRVHALVVKNREGAAFESAQRAFAAEVQAWYEKALKSSLRPDGSIDATAAEAEFAAIVDRGLRSMFSAAAVSALRSIGSEQTFQITRQDAIDYLQGRAGELIRSVTGTLKETIGNAVANGFAEGKTVAQIQAEVEASGVSAFSAERIIRTEASLAYNEGARQAWAAEGVDGKDFILAGGPCPVCEAVYAAKGGKTTPIGEPYYKAGESVTGTDGRTYTFERDVQGPPFHPSCRCTTIPASKEGAP